MKVRAVLIALVLVLGLTGSAHAGVFLWTAPLYIDSGQYVRCSVTNVSNYAISVGADAFDGAGTRTLLYGNYNLNPHVTVSYWSSSSPTICRFTVPSAAYVRANACLSNFNTLSCLTETEAR
jgi:hypothetical protein